jgi:DNA-binding SARP family transcriptional activator
MVKHIKPMRIVGFGDPPHTLRVRLLGRFSAHFGSRPVRLPDGAKSQELFVYLLLKRHRAHTREEIASQLWADADSVRSKAYLRKALWQLRSALAEAAGEGLPSSVVEVDGEWLRVHPGAPVWLDVAVIERAYAKARWATGGSLQPGTAVELRDAVALYSGDLLPNRYQSWYQEARERLKLMYLDMLEKLLDFSEAQGEHEVALSYGRSVLALDSTREHVYRQLMRVHRLRGDRAGAIRQYEHCVEVLETELGVPPMQETQTLYEHIHREGGPYQNPVERPTSPADSLQDVVSLQNIVERLDDLQTALDGIRREVDLAVRTRRRAGA